MKTLAIPGMGLDVVMWLAPARRRLAGDPPSTWSRGDWALVAVRVTAVVAYGLVFPITGIYNVFSEPDFLPPVAFWALVAAVPLAAVAVSWREEDRPYELRDQTVMLTVLEIIVPGLWALAVRSYLVVLVLAVAGLVAAVAMPRRRQEQELRDLRQAAKARRRAARKGRR